MRICITLSYDGTAYCGWQNQDNGVSVQSVIESAVEKLTGEKTSVTGSGRTDAGVHALGQAAHFDTHSSVPPDKFSYALNTILPPDIRILDSREVSADFHARFGASRKTYRYVICNRKHASAVMRNFSYHEPRNLDMEDMTSAASYLEGEHDFSAFCAAGSQSKTFVRTLYDVSVKKDGDFISFEYTGNGFLYNMVRILTGTLVYVGLGKIRAYEIPEIIRSKDRTRAGVTMPPHGLFLVSVEYAQENCVEYAQENC